MPINTRELRLGNFVRVGDKIVKVNGITQHKIGYCPSPGRETYARSRVVEPIAITKEIKEKCHAMLSLNTDNGKYGVLLGSGFIDVEYIHDLQNQYYNHYHKELVIDLQI